MAPQVGIFLHGKLTIAIGSSRHEIEVAIVQLKLAVLSAHACCWYKWSRCLRWLTTCPQLVGLHASSLLPCIYACDLQIPRAILLMIAACAQGRSDTSQVNSSLPLRRCTCPKICGSGTPSSHSTTPWPERRHAMQIAQTALLGRWWAHPWSAHPLPMKLLT